ncbi:hypothetical protein SBA2_200010 [Acidobacteriia bacterium SbA2]|nr:hypothetical protein SBA2_200010 [Acidobacteriia bacterium SbA2]
MERDSSPPLFAGQLARRMVTAHGVGPYSWAARRCKASKLPYFSASLSLTEQPRLPDTPLLEKAPVRSAFSPNRAGGGEARRTA